jgi:hypothetical protein
VDRRFLFGHLVSPAWAKRPDCSVSMIPRDVMSPPQSGH